MTTELDLAPIKERLARATPGPWRMWQDPRPGHENKTAVETAWAHGDIEGDTELITDYLPTRADARFIAEAPADIEALIGEVERLREQVEAVRAIHKPLDALNTNSNRIGQVCLGCGQDNGNWNDYPCPTIRALEVGE